MISTDRVAGARAIVARTPLLDAIVMDDGLLNPGLAKDLRIAVVDGRRGVGNGRVIPAGPLRARLAFQLALADAIVINQPAASAAPVPPAESPVGWLREMFPGPVLRARPEPIGDVGWLAARPLVAFAGIANPHRFYDLLDGLGGKVAETVSFADHHAFREGDARRLLALAAKHGADLVTTQKDHVRLIGGRNALGDLHAASRPLPIRLCLDERDRVRLGALVDGVCRKRPSAAPAAP